MALTIIAFHIRIKKGANGSIFMKLRSHPFRVPTCRMKSNIFSIIQHILKSKWPEQGNIRIFLFPVSCCSLVADADSGEWFFLPLSRSANRPLNNVHVIEAGTC